MKKYDVGVFIGRMRPFHNGHKKIIEQMLSEVDSAVIVIGSAYKATDHINPFTHEEVAEMIRGSFSDEDNMRINIVGARDRGNLTKWTMEIRHKVGMHIKPCDTVGLYGHDKDNSSFYLYHFADWYLEKLPRFGDYNATDIREQILRLYETEAKRNLNTLYDDGAIPTGTYNFLTDWIGDDEYNRIFNEKLNIDTINYQFESEGTKKYNSLPFHYTCDSVVIHAGCVLMVKRDSYPGKGLWSLPGSHVLSDETAEQASIRSLIEKTKINIPKSKLVSSMKQSKIYDEPRRSTRQRTITNAFLYHLVSNKSGTDDQKIRKDFSHPKVFKTTNISDIRWIPISVVLSDEFGYQIFEDHGLIIEQLNDWLNGTQ